MGRNPSNIKKHFFTGIEPIISKYKAGTLDKNYTEVLVKHMVENNFSYPQEGKWTEIVGLSKFDGMSSCFLRCRYNTAKWNCKKQNPNLSLVDLTSREILKYLEETEKRVK